jgi:hypothetical protein
MIRGRNFIGSRRVGPGPAPDRECDGGEESHDNGAHDGVRGSEIDRNCGEGAVVESGSGPEAALAAAVEAAIAPAAGGSLAGLGDSWPPHYDPRIPCCNTQIRRIPCRNTQIRSPRCSGGGTFAVGSETLIPRRSASAPLKRLRAQGYIIIRGDWPRGQKAPVIMRSCGCECRGEREVGELESHQDQNRVGRLQLRSHFACNFASGEGGGREIKIQDIIVQRSWK